MVGKILINLGTWFNKHFPEKISTDEVYSKFTAIELRLHDVTVLSEALVKLDGLYTDLNARVEALSKKTETLTSENTALKAQAALRTRIASTIPMPGR